MEYTYSYMLTSMTMHKLWTFLGKTSMEVDFIKLPYAYITKDNYKYIA